MGAMSSLKEADEYTKTTPVQETFCGSVEEEAMAAFMAKKKAEDMREQLRTIITYSRGLSAWQELLKTEADIRVKRQKMIYDQKERQRKFIEWTAITVMLMILVGTVTWFMWFVMKAKGMI